MGGTIYSKLVTYTIDAVDTWERKEITVQANTNSNNPTLSSSEGLRVAFDLGSGPDDVVPIFDWNSTYGGATRVAAGQVNLLDSTSNYWQITGVQLEVGDTATPFEHRSYGDELQRCQRYFYRKAWSGSGDKFNAGAVYDTTNVVCSYWLPVSPRAEPYLTWSNLELRQGNTSKTITSIGSVVTNTGSNDVRLTVVSSGLTAGYSASFRATGTGHLSFDAEL
jgi:hypothetical protein